ncbi:MAG: hypothetical protein A2648_02830 [Candidatus Lloydbacteria bacterium RIFCSPHIGHO2_01_FULL_41_20]|uniref:Pilin n=1 Tax=Candidatus Lloydbacteria bacterium RIFCSPHIGHO2_01_FULL_41_20 TaxID=1798657 RepID=A0A1G2CVR8_9BACT|nr:MAG: hypothetical protein A2648_02830 [Candidatus Lloydbacteria bacterium RIFCSPHIGHO2_01_FULL_41_20]
MNKNKGFTLIELLVVIAIIGILSSVVIASINQARDKGNDAAIQSNLNGIRSQATLYYDTNSQSYGTAGVVCDTAGSVFVDPTITNQIKAAESASAGEPGIGITATCANDDSGWVVSVPMKTAGNWCVDSTGSAATTTANTSTIKCN